MDHGMGLRRRHGLAPTHLSSVEGAEEQGRAARFRAAPRVAVSCLCHACAPPQAHHTCVAWCVRNSDARALYVYCVLENQKRPKEPPKSKKR
jgi:hypothetical protein